MLSLTKYELNIVVQMMNNNMKTLSTENRALLREQLNTDVNTLNNYVKRLRDKGVLIDTAYGLAVNPNIINSLADREFHIKFNINEHKTSDHQVNA